MVVTASETQAQNAEVIFAIETNSANGAFIGDLKTNYIIPTLEYFHGGPLEEGLGGGSVYSIVTYTSADCLPGLPVATYGPFTSPQHVVETVDKLQFIGGHAESRACVTEAFATALTIFEELGRTDVPMHVLLLCCSPPYSAYGGGIVPPGCPATIEQACRLFAERGVQLSIASARRLPSLHALYEHAGGELLAAQQRNYAKDPRHMVLLRGYSLKERPPSPAPPAPDTQPMDVYGAGRGAAVRGPAPGFARAPAPAARGYLVPRAPVYAPNSALLTQLAQPSYPPPPAQLAQPQRLPSMLQQPGPSTSGAGVGVPMQRQYIWSGVLEWIEKGKGPGDQQKVTKVLPCQVSANSKDVEPELKVDTWPSTLLMQLMPKQLISNIGGQYLKDSKSVLFHLQQNEALEQLTKVMVNGFAGCVHFSSPSQCDIKVLILLYTPDKKAYLGFIPNNQANFVDRLRKVIQQQKITQIINKQQLPAAGPSGTMGGTMPTATMTGSSGMPSMGIAGGMSAGMSAGMSGGMGAVGSMPQMPQQVSQAGAQPMQQQQHPPSMMMGGMSAQQGAMGKVPRSVTQLDGLEAARQQNLEKIQHLQQTLEAAHQQVRQEAQFKSQMDIMSHLQHAQQQEMNYKQLEEQRKQQQFQQQQQLQQQLRGAGVGGVGGGGGQRIMRPMMPSNPGLRHLLQQPQYRPGGGTPRPPAPQQFDDVSNYDFL